MTKKLTLISALTGLLSLLMLNFSYAQGIMMGVPTQTSSYSDQVRGLWFVAPTDFVISGLRVPAGAGTGLQNIQVMKINGTIAVWSVEGTNFTTLYYINNQPNNTIINVNIPIAAGDTIGILGQAGTTTAYATESTYATTIAGQPTTLGRFLHQGNINVTAAYNYSTEPSGNIGIVEMYYTVDTCEGQPTAGTVPPNMGVCSGVPFTITATGATAFSSGLSGQWQSSDAGANNWINIPSATAPTYTVAAGITSAKDYRYIVNCSISSLSDTTTTLAVSINPANECYCNPGGTNSSYYINNFSTTNAVQNISKLNSGFAPGGYGDYTATDTLVQIQGGDVNFTSDFTTGYVFGATIWVDWNHNGSFEATEAVYQTTALSGTISGTFTVPATTLLGTTRMRVGIYQNLVTGPQPCDNTAYTEFEDYIVNVVQCNNIVVNLGNDTTLCSGGTLTLDAGNPGLAYTWSTGATGQTINVNASGTYAVDVFDGVCTVSDTINVTMLPQPSAGNIQVTTLSECSYYFELTNAQDVTTYLWNFGDGTPTSSQMNPTHNFSNGTYSVSVVATNNCGSTTRATQVTCATTGIEGIGISDNAINIYPNPANSQLTVESDGNIRLEQVTLYNILGQVVLDYSVANALTYQMNIAHLPAGIYTAKIQTNKGIVNKKLEVVK